MRRAKRRRRGSMFVIKIENSSCWDAVEIDGSLRSYQDLVGGWIETVMAKKKGLLMLVDEEGKIKGLPINMMASHIMSPLYVGDLICGTAVLVRLNESGDDWTGWSDRNEAIYTFTSMLNT